MRQLANNEYNPSQDSSPASVLMDLGLSLMHGLGPPMEL